MLKALSVIPEDKRIAGVHCVPIMENGSIVMAWDKDEQVLTTIGGRLEGEENIDEALEREAMEEVGMTISSEKIPFASWYWESTDTYTIWFLVKAQKFLPYTFDFEKTGYVIFNFETANQIISKLEPNNKTRIEILKLAYEKAQELNLFENLN
ncbi:NUDIX domain-containing protein [Ureibacillus sp. MALMAid1270]|uniref:NUDIX domain-containing protein n=1 Tax=Ureibacillus sp. MALMAid1270 TaxID=3411629 RepID=UPI003BA40D9C